MLFKSRRARTTEPEFRHPGLERRRLQAELLRRSPRSANPPFGALEHREDVFALDIDELDAAAKGDGGPPREDDRELVARRRDHRALDEVSQLTDVSGPRILLQGEHVLAA